MFPLTIPFMWLYQKLKIICFKKILHWTFERADVYFEIDQLQNSLKCQMFTRTMLHMGGVGGISMSDLKATIRYVTYT